MKIDVMCVGAIAENCYILSSQITKNAVVIDPGAQPNDILKFCENKGLTIKMILLTHGHFDHIGATTLIKEKTKAPIIIYEADNELLLNPDLMHMGIANQMEEEYGYKKASADKFIADGEIIKLDEISIKVIHTKGHTKGSCCFLAFTDDANAEQFLISGDTLFEGSVGRTDLYGGNSNDLLSSIKKLANSDINATVLPGHGEKTTLAIERIKNPFMGQNYDDIF